jgi:hypothetical protein
MTARCETDQGDRLKAALESLRDFLNECVFKFLPEGIELIGQDRAKVVAIRYMLPASKLRETGGLYECSVPKGIEVGIKTKAVANCLKCSTAGDVVSIGVEPQAPGKLVIMCRNVSKVSRWEVITPTVPDDDTSAVDIESLKFSGTVTMPSSLFHDMVRDLATAEEPTVRLYCDGKRLVLSSNGSMTNMTFELNSGDDHTNTQFRESAGETARWPVDEIYPLAFLQKIAKAKNICSRISVHLRPNFPAAFVYDSPIGSLTYLVAPREEDPESARVRVKIPPPLPTLPAIPRNKKRPLPAPPIPLASDSKRRRKQMPAVKSESESESENEEEEIVSD